MGTIDGDGIRRRLYLDVDGTLLRRGGKVRPPGGLSPAPHLRSFLEWATANFTCIWLTSRGRDGDAGGIRAAFRQAIGPGHEFDAIDALLAGIDTACWDGCKAEAIDFTAPFFWLDDAPEEASLDLLERRGAAGRWIAVAVDARPDDLLRVMRQLA